MGRRFTIAAGISFAVCMAVAALWIWSIWFEDGGGREAVRPIGNGLSRYTSAGFSSGAGALQVERSTQVAVIPGDASAVPGWRWFHERVRDPVRAFLNSKNYRPYLTRSAYGDPPGALSQGRGTNFGLVLPYWIPFLLSAIVPLWWVARFRRTCRRDRRRKRGLCVACGYDLRGSEGRCPECGAETQAADGAGALRG